MVQKFIEPPFYEYCHRYNNTYIGLDYSLNKLLDYIRINKIDGIIAFSQATYVTFLLHKIYRLKFFISVCGLPYFGDLPEIILKDSLSYDIKSLHIIGKKDPLYKLGLKFYQCYCDTTLLEHNQGHCFPKDKNINDKIIEWIQALT